ncbi:MAG: SGNH/GDSL hydrolase family protein [Acidimicrobiales bacterium]|nr:SGNH/GDSL hydrolase family protein [Acidimicrobiales bacterium]
MIRTRSAGVAAVALAVLGLLAASAPPTSARAMTQHLRWAVLGDSYASGEGIAGTGPPCARSDRAYGPLARTLLRDQRDWTIDDPAFVACTGAVSTEIYGARPEDPAVASQVDQATADGGGHFDVVTLSIGGNDIGFSELLESCLRLPFPLEGWPKSWTDLDEVKHITDVGIGCTTPESELEDRIDGLASRHSIIGEDGEADALSDLYRRLADDLLSDDGILVVSGYPRLFQPSDDWPAWRGHECNLVSAEDADMLGRLSERLDQVLRSEVEKADPSGQQIVYESRLELFDGNGASHALCGRPTTEWVNGIAGLSDGSFRKEHSFHPNEPGHAATAEDVATKVEDALGDASTEPTTTEPRSTTAPPGTTAPPDDDGIDSGGTFDVGDRFEATCTIAWPTAPSRTTSTIEMTTSCTGVPGQFLFVHISYDDPDLPVAPSPATMHVVGTIADISVSEYGYKTLIVLAEAVDLE